MDLREVVAALRAAWWLPMLGLLVGASSAFAISSLATPLYMSSTQFFVSSTASGSTLEAFQGSQLSQQRVATYARLLRGEALAERVVDRLNIDLSAQQLSGQIEATPILDTVFIDVTVSDASPQLSESIAVAIGEEFPVLVRELESSDADAAPPVKVTVTDEPELPSQPSSPQTLQNVVLGGFLGVLLGIVLSILRARLDNTIRAPDVAVDMSGAPVIGTVLRDDALNHRHLVTEGASSRTAEDFRQLRTNLQFLSVDSPTKVIMVSSAMPAEGKTTVVVNLGLALADAGRRVAIIEADLRRPKVTRYLGMVGGAGVTNVLAGTALLEEVVQVYGDGRLRVIAAGPTPPNPGELLASSQMSVLLDKLRAENDYVLVDAPPLLPVADSSGLAALMDGVLLSVRYGKTTRDQLRQAATTLERVGARSLGVILNIVPPKAELASAYGYGYSYGPESKHGKR